MYVLKSLKEEGVHLRNELMAEKNYDETYKLIDHELWWIPSTWTDTHTNTQKHVENYIMAHYSEFLKTNKKILKATRERKVH